MFFKKALIIISYSLENGDDKNIPLLPLFPSGFGRPWWTGHTQHLFARALDLRAQLSWITWGGRQWTPAEKQAGRLWCPVSRLFPCCSRLKFILALPSPRAWPSKWMEMWMVHAAHLQAKMGFLPSQKIARAQRKTFPGKNTRGFCPVMLAETPGGEQCFPSGLVEFPIPSGCPPIKPPSRKVSHFFPEWALSYLPFFPWKGNWTGNYKSKSAPENGK